MLAPMVRRILSSLSALAAALILAGAGWLVSAQAAGNAQRDLPGGGTLRGELLSVADGDSFKMRAADGRVWQVRIAAIDAPERTQPWSDVARKQLQQRLQSREIMVQASKFDPYGRVVGNVFVAGEDIGLAQVVDGLAWHFRRYAHEQEAGARKLYGRAEATARKARRGLWHDSDPLPPWEFRSRMRGGRGQNDRSRASAPAPGAARAD